MAKQIKLDQTYMKMAYDATGLSHATRHRVGAILVIPEEGRFEGVNGTPSGFDNCCEMETSEGFVTKPECLHAESNAIMKVARSRTSSVGGTMYCTLLPCLECSKLIIQAGIVRVVYAEQYPYSGHSGPIRAMGLDLLISAGIQVDNFPIYSHNVNNDEPSLQDEGWHNLDEDAWRRYA